MPTIKPYRPSMRSDFKPIYFAQCSIPNKKPRPIKGIYRVVAALDYEGYVILCAFIPDTNQ